MSGYTLTERQWANLRMLIDLQMTRLLETVSIQFDLPEEASEDDPSDRIWAQPMLEIKHWIEKYIPKHMQRTGQTKETTAMSAQGYRHYLLSKYNHEGLETYTEVVFRSNASAALTRLAQQVIQDEELSFGGFSVLPCNERGDPEFHVVTDLRHSKRTSAKPDSVTMVWTCLTEDGPVQIITKGTDRVDCRTLACERAVLLYNDKEIGPDALRDLLTYLLADDYGEVVDAAYAKVMP